MVVTCKLPAEAYTLLRTIDGESLYHQCSDAHQFWNGCPYVPDLQNYGVTDYWATPMQISENGGDCEDYAIAKYFTLLAAGVAVSALKIVYVMRASEPHMVLLVAGDSDSYVLDNLRDGVASLDFCGELHPVYAFSHDGMFEVDEGWGFKLIRTDLSSMSLWQDLLKRIEEEL